MRRDPLTAGTLCHRESGFIQEIATEVALRTSQHVWVDGSLRDGDWFVGVFDDIRTRYPDYRIAIFSVHASERVVRARCDSRARETGRAIPEHALVGSLQVRGGAPGGWWVPGIGSRRPAGGSGVHIWCFLAECDPRRPPIGVTGVLRPEAPDGGQHVLHMGRMGPREWSRWL